MHMTLANETKYADSTPELNPFGDAASKNCNWNSSSGLRFNQRSLFFNGPIPVSFCLFSSYQHDTNQTRSPGLVIMGGYSCSRGRGFESQCHILDGHFSH